MTTKKVLLMVGLLAAIGIAWWAFNGTPTDEGEEGAIGAANRYRAEQITDSDVALQDEEVITLLQDDVFLELIQDEDFQTLMAREDFAAALSRQGVEAIYGRMTPSAALSHRDVVAMAARDDVTAFLARPDVQAAFDKSWKVWGEGQDKEGRKGRSDNVWGRTNIEAFQRQIVAIAEKHNIKFVDIGDGSKVGKGHLKAQEIAQLMSRPAVMQVMGRQDLRAEMLNKNYIELAKSWKVWGEGQDKEGRKGRSDNVWGARQEVALQKLPNVAALDKSWKVWGEGQDKEGRKGRSDNIWGKYHTELIGKSHVVEALGRYDVAMFMARPDVQQALDRLNVQQAFAAHNIEATLGKFHIASVPGGGKKQK